MKIRKKRIENRNGRVKNERKRMVEIGVCGSVCLCMCDPHSASCMSFVFLFKYTTS